MIRRILVIAAFLLAFVAAHAAAQLQAPNRRDVVDRVASACPGLILQDHAFTDAVASVLTAEDARWGRNGKRGNPNDLSHDAIAFKNPASPFGVSIVDIIGAAGSPSASPAWIDQTQATIDARTTGVWIAPSGRLPACLSGTAPPPVVTPPPPSPIVTPIPSDVASAITAMTVTLARVEARLAAIEARPVPDFLDVAVFNAYIDDMVGKGPSGDPQVTPNHITDIKERLDVLRVSLDQLNAWLRSRTILRR
jgi:hypothetical protein